MLAQHISDITGPSSGAFFYRLYVQIWYVAIRVLPHTKSAHSYLLTPWSRVLLEKLTGFAANQQILRVLWNPKVHYHVVDLIEDRPSWSVIT